MIHVNRLHHPLGTVPPRDATHQERSYLREFIGAVSAKFRASVGSIEMPQRYGPDVCPDCGCELIKCRCVGSDA